jgi:hypothetical protein
MSVHPKSSQDLFLAPVAVDVDTNLRPLREMSQGELVYDLALELNQPIELRDRSDRERAILGAATRFVHLHNYDASISDDATRLRLSGGSESLDLGLSPSITEYLRGTE